MRFLLTFLVVYAVLSIIENIDPITSTTFLLGAAVGYVACLGDSMDKE